MKKTVTIFTPTYNRAYCIKELYHSLLAQKNKDFCWLIIDDGSTDETASIIKKYIAEKKIEITYEYQKNMGKYVAINKAVDLVDTELFFIVDSDDTLSFDAVDKIIRAWEEIDSKENYCGIAFRCLDKKTGNLVGRELAPDFVDCTLFDRYNKYKLKGDLADVLKVSAMKGKKFPVIHGEKLFSELYLWIDICGDLKMRFFKEGIYYCEYLPGGYTKNFNKLLWKNTTAFTLNYKKVLADKRWNLIMRVKAFIRLIQVYCISSLNKVKNIIEK